MKSIQEYGILTGGGPRQSLALGGEGVHSFLTEYLRPPLLEKILSRFFSNRVPFKKYKRKKGPYKIGPFLKDRSFKA